tara:strand:- start:921 stop:1718 length:798 start_codon:yes stop_codon:yes gene_type:complete
MITLSTMGGLGNQMFQIAALHSLSLSSAYSYEVCPQKHYGPLQGNPFSRYESTIFSKVPRGCTSHADNLSNLSLGHTPFLDNKAREYNGSFGVYGYFQSPDFFSSCFSEIRELYGPSPQEINYLNKKYNFTASSLCIGVRRGDYEQSGIHIVQPLDYYLNAIKLLKGKFDFNPRTVFLTSDDPAWCKDHLGFLNFTLLEEEDYLDMYAMSLCPFIIGSNSTFHWWGAFLSTSLEQACVFPSLWLNGVASSSMDHLFSPFSKCFLS